MSERSDALKTLHATLIDSRDSYRAAIGKSEVDDLAQLFTEMVDLRKEAAEQIEDQLTSLGETSDEPANSNGRVIDLNSRLEKLDEMVLAPLIDGEKKILELYEKAIADTDPDASEYSVLLTQRDDLAGKISAMERLENQHAA